MTPEGERAYLFHERLHAEFDRLVEGLLADASERDRDFLRNFLGALDVALERWKLEDSLRRRSSR